MPVKNQLDLKQKRKGKKKAKRNHGEDPRMLVNEVGHRSRLNHLYAELLALDQGHI